MRPRCCLRYFTFFGINISQLLASSSWPNLLAYFWFLTFLKRAHTLLLFLLLGRKYFALVHPALHANHAVSRPCFREAILDVGTQRMQRQASLQIPFRARDLIAIQSPANPDLDPLAAEAQRRIHRLTHRPPESYTFFQLQRDRFRNQLRIEFRLMHFLDIDKHFARSAFLQIGLQLVDFRALASDDDSGTRRLDNDAQLVARTLDLDRTHARRFEFFLQLVLQLDVFEQQLVVVPFHKPARLPRLGVAKTKTIRMDFLSHCFS